MKSAVAALLIAALGLPVSTFSGAAQARALTAVDGIAAVVDEDVILQSELQRAVANILQQYADQPDRLPPRDILERQVLERLVLMRLQLARAEQTGVRVADAELAQAIQGIAANNGMSIDQLRERLAADRVPYEEYRKSVREEMQVQRLRQRVAQGRVQVGEGEIDQLLATAEIGGAEVRLANILVALPDGATPDQIATAQKKIDGIKDLIDSGELDFAAAAIRYSDAPNALEGGDIGWREFDAIPPAFVDMLRNMNPGDITPAVRGPTGFQLVKLVESRDSAQQTMTQFNAQSILIRITDLLPAEAARQKAQELRDRIQAGGDFAALAKQHSEDTLTRDKGGDMGWFGVNDWGTAIANQLQQLADGEVSPVFQSDIGFHIIKRIGSREQDVTELNRRNKAREMIGQRKAEEEYERFLRQLRADAYVDSRLGG